MTTDARAADASPAVPVTTGPSRQSGRRVLSVLPTVPFFGYVAIFLVLPTIVVIIGAFQGNDGSVTFENLRALARPAVVAAFGQSVALSAITAVIGAVVGGVLAYVLASGRPGSVLRNVVSSACAVLAQFGGVMLAFAFIATVGSTGMVTNLLRNLLGIGSTGGWLYDFPGLVLVYSYFQIPLMVIVFLPAVDGIRPQWREATETLGGSTAAFWRLVAGPLLAPAFLGATLLLFANAFSAYATAAALITGPKMKVTTRVRTAAEPVVRSIRCVLLVQAAGSRVTL